MRFERSGLGSPPPGPPFVTDEALREYLRLPDGSSPLLDEARGLSDVAGFEVEDYGSLALLDQSITVIAERHEVVPVMVLPVGPVPSDATITVEVLDETGAATTVSASDYFLETGRHGRLRFTEAGLPELEAGETLRVTYDAGHGADQSDLPADLRHAILSHTGKLLDRKYEEGRGAPGPSLAPEARRIAARSKRVSV